MGARSVPEGSGAAAALRGPQIGADARHVIRLCTDLVGIHTDMLLLGSAYVSHAGPDGVCTRCGVDFGG